MSFVNIARLCFQVGVFARKFHITGLVRDAPKLSLPGKLVFPSMHNTGHFSMLGLGDIVRVLLCAVLLHRHSGFAALLYLFSAAF